VCVYKDLNILICMNIKAVFPSNSFDIQKMKYLVNSLDFFNIPYDIIGLGKEFTYLNKIFWLYEYLQNQNDTDIIFFSDAYDVFYTQSLEIIKNKFIHHNTEILWSCEKGYWHGLSKQKEIYDKLGNKYKYNYLNSGTFMGYVYALKIYIGDIINEINNKDGDLNNNLKKDGCRCTPLTHLSGINGDYFCDQQIYSYFYAENHHKYSIKLDYNLTIFYIPVHDWDMIDNYISFKNNCVYNNITKSFPCIIHCPWLKKYRHIYDYIYNSVFIPVIDKKYVWKHDCKYVNGYIWFHKNKLETSWGDGTYNTISKTNYILVWNNVKHNIIFNNDLSEFKSVRCHDLHISSGELLPKDYNIKFISL